MVRLFVAAAVVWMAGVAQAEAQLGALVSPGRLAAPHAALEGLSNCSKCHEQGRRVTPQKCLACHAPIAERIARRSGVHRTAGGDCVSCHADHAGVDGELRPFDQKGFDHTANTRFPLDGRHAPIAGQCAACHKTRSFLSASTACGSCHADVHKPSLGPNCQTCHATTAAFKAAGGTFDHAKAAFPLSGAHKNVTCVSCHANSVFKGVKSAACSDCHRDPHKPALGTTCTTCHTSDSWRTERVNHTRTAFPLQGRHARVTCVACHAQPAMKAKPRSDTCAACHADVHRGTFTQDCKSCHTENGFETAPFDHATTRFTLNGKHDGLACEQCHKPAAVAVRPAVSAVAGRRPPPRPVTTAVDFRGLSMTCVSCHADVHRAELGTSCETCHSASTFTLPAYTHKRSPAFFGGQHASIACDRCHTPAPLTAPVRTGASPLRVTYTSAVTTCASCHADVHLGQEGTACETCHTLEREKFVVPDFRHVTTGFALSGRHTAVACAGCHTRETGTFPAGLGTAVRYRGVGRECRTCHVDPHLGQVSARCESCHTDAGWPTKTFTHTSRATQGFFTGKHVSARCEDCHPRATGSFPSGHGTAMRFTVGVTCVSCHIDVHRGAMGSDCSRCHRP